MFFITSSMILTVLRLSAAFENNYCGAHSRAALIRGRRSFEGGAHSGAALKRVNTVKTRFIIIKIYCISTEHIPNIYHTSKNQIGVRSTLSIKNIKRKIAIFFKQGSNNKVVAALTNAIVWCSSLKTLYLPTKILVTQF